jgi:hypothetical protein
MRDAYLEDSRMTDLSLTRRRFATVLAAVPVAAVFASREAAAQANAATLPKLDLNDPVAKALMYTHDAKTVKAPIFKPGSDCTNCIQIQGKSGDWRPCTAFPGKLVAAKGWCSAWAPKPA